MRKLIENHETNEGAGLIKKTLCSFVQRLMLLKKVTIPVRSGLDRLFGLIRSYPEIFERPTILSVNWSSQLIRMWLKHHQFDSDNTFVKVMSNELVFDYTMNAELHQGGMSSTGEIRGDIHSALDKMRYMKKAKSEKDQSCSARVVTIYVGDSLNDLLAMLEVNYGIWLREEPESSSLKRACSLFDIKVIDLDTETDTETVGNRCIRVAKSWDDICRWLESRWLR